MIPDQFRTVMEFRADLAEILVKYTKDNELALDAADVLMSTFIIKDEGEE